VDNLLGSRNNGVERGKMMRGKIRWCMAPSTGSHRGEASEGRRMARWILTQRFSNMMGGGAGGGNRGGVDSEWELKEVVWRFVSPTHEQGRMVDGDLRCSGTVGEAAAALGS
jgi:hypothetical protein